MLRTTQYVPSSAVINARRIMKYCKTAVPALHGAIMKPPRASLKSPRYYIESEGIPCPSITTTRFFDPRMADHLKGRLSIGAASQLEELADPRERPAVALLETLVVDQ